MAGLSTEDIMNVALRLAFMDEVPPDSGIQVPSSGIDRLLVSIDGSVGEVLLAHHLGADALLVHHPFGGASRVQGYQFYQRHVDLMIRHGVPQTAAQKAVEQRLESMALAGQSSNYDQVVAAAETLGIGIMNIHGPLDEIGRTVLQECCDRVSGQDAAPTAGDLVRALSGIPELQASLTDVSLVVGTECSAAGRAVVAHGALTNGGYHVARTYFQHGVDTVVYIHIDAASAASLRKDGRGNLIVTGHIASDWIGINPFLRSLRGLGVDVIALSPLAAVS